jgi:hypothetical protein
MYAQKQAPVVAWNTSACSASKLIAMSAIQHRTELLHLLTSFCATTTAVYRAPEPHRRRHHHAAGRCSQQRWHDTAEVQ